jgi:hypothetical protein
VYAAAACAVPCDYLINNFVNRFANFDALGRDIVSKTSSGRGFL